MSKTHPPTTVGPWLALLFSAVSGLLYWLAFPPTDAWPLAFLCWAPLLVAIQGRGARDAFLLGATQGVVVYVCGARWLPAVIQTFGRMSPLAAVLLAVPLWIYCGGRSAVLAALTAHATARGRRPGVAFVLAFAATETAYPMLFPVYAAAQVHRMPLLMQLAEVGGPVLVGALLAASSVALAEIVGARLERRPTDRAPLAFLAGPVALVAYGAWRVPAVERDIAGAPRATVGIVQANVPHAGASIPRAIEMHRGATETLQRAARLDLVVWPETALGGVVPRDGLERILLDDVVMSPAGETLLSVPVIAGAILKDHWELRNSAVLFDGAGVKGVYDKIRPLVVGEYLPLVGTFPKLRKWLPNAGEIVAGTSTAPLPLGEHRISALICYEDVLAGFANDVVRAADPDLLVNLTNDSWFGDSNVSGVHLALAKYRAIEHRRFLVSASNSGISAFVDPIGRSSGETALFRAAALTGEVRWMRAQTPYERIGDLLGWLAVASIGAMAFVRSIADAAPAAHVGPRLRPERKGSREA
jgi:apolipoprotein N-acyltransferase